MTGNAPLLETERSRPVSINGKEYDIASDDRYLDHVGGEFEPATVRLLKRLVRPGDVALDIGANIGCTAILLGELAGSVHAFEPCPSTFSFLQDNVTRSGLRNITCRNAGLGAERGSSTITYNARDRSGAFVAERMHLPDGHVSETISIEVLDEVIDEVSHGRADFIKIDVEGFEPFVLRGGRQTLERNRPTVLLELNHWCLNVLQRVCLPDFFDLLRDTFPLLYAVDGDRCRDLHNADAAFHVMNRHLMKRAFRDIVGGFERERLKPMLSMLRKRRAVRAGASA